MKKTGKIVIVLFALVLALSLATSASAIALDPVADLGTWQKFFFGGVGSSSSDNYTFTLTDTLSFYVTDAYQIGDVFDVYDGAILIGSTNFVAMDASEPISPLGDQALTQQAYDSGLYSVGEFVLGAGIYDMSMITAVSPFGSGGAYVKLDTSTAIPEPGTMLLLGTGLIGLAYSRRKLNK